MLLIDNMASEPSDQNDQFMPSVQLTRKNHQIGQELRATGSEMLNGRPNNPPRVKPHHWQASPHLPRPRPIITNLPSRSRHGDIIWPSVLPFSMPFCYLLKKTLPISPLLFS